MSNKIILAAAAALMLFAVPAQAQHRDHGQHGGQRGGNRGGQRHEQPRHEEHDRQRERERGHYDGRRFDRDYRERYFGRGHYFTPEIEVWGGGYRFFYGGFYFGIVEPIPFYTENMYIDLDGDVYYLYAPTYPGWRMQVNVIIP